VPRASTQSTEEIGNVSEIKHVVRIIGDRAVPSHGVVEASEFEAYLKKTYFDEGWVLFKAQFEILDGRQMGGLNFNPIQAVYLLVK